MHPTDPRILDGSAPLDVAIIGGGAAGVLVATHLLRVSAGRVRVCIIEPRSRLGEGAAYSTRDPNHILNVRAGGMSAFEGDPVHFIRYLQSERNPVEPVEEAADPTSRFMPRATFGRYLRSTLDEQAQSRPLHIRDEAIGVAGTGPYTVALRSGQAILASAVVLAVGNAPRPLGDTVAGESVPAVIYGWDYPAVAAIPRDSDVCIVGSGLSMVDVAMTLQAIEHRGRIHVLSRHGLLPLAHAQDGSPPGVTDEELFSGSMTARMRRLRLQTDARLRAGQPWQWTMDLLRPHGQRLWQSLDAVEQRRFLRHARPYWDVHRHRIAPEIATRLANLVRSRQLSVQAGRLESIKVAPKGLQVGFRPRGDSRMQHLQVGRVVACTGIESCLRRMHSPLMQALAARGTVSPGPFGLGLAIGNAAGALVTTQGILQPRFLTLGSSRIGQVWESSAIPEIRAQAVDIGQWLLRHLRN